jgi:hypothetical protein
VRRKEERNGTAQGEEKWKIVCVQVRESV